MLRFDSLLFFFFFFNGTAPTEIYPLSLHGALPICDRQEWSTSPARADFAARIVSVGLIGVLPRSEEHTSELQSPCNLIFPLLSVKNETHVIRTPSHRMGDSDWPVDYSFSVT